MNDALDPHSETHGQPKMGTERNFGRVFAAVFAIIAVWPLVRGGQVRLWSLATAAVLLAVTLIAPRTLAPLNRIWFQIGILVSKVMTPLVMGLLWLVVMTPVAFLMRVFGQDPLRLKRELTAKSYWLERQPPGPVAGSLKDQF
jgi:hypothetical protein